MSNRQVLYFNGTILTMDEDLPTAGAVLTEGERIVAVGDEADLRSGSARDCDEFDLQGYTMMPAFIDPHGHFPDPGFIQLFRVDLAPPPRGNCVDMAAALLRLAEKAAQTPTGDWVMGVLFDNTAIAERRMPTRTELDGVSTEHPIWVLHASGHNGVANSCALDHQGIDRDTSDPAGGRFGRDPDTGDLTGLIEGISAMGAMGDTNFLIDHTRFWQGFAACRDEYLSHGVTFAQNAWASLDMLDKLCQLTRRRRPRYRHSAVAHRRVGTGIDARSAVVSMVRTLTSHSVRVNFLPTVRFNCRLPYCVFNCALSQAIKSGCPLRDVIHRSN